MQLGIPVYQPLEMDMFDGFFMMTRPGFPKELESENHIDRE